VICTKPVVASLWYAVQWFDDLQVESFLLCDTLRQSDIKVAIEGSCRLCIGLCDITQVNTIFREGSCNRQQDSLADTLYS
jgi:hypothetical protein